MNSTQFFEFINEQFWETMAAIGVSALLYFRKNIGDWVGMLSRHFFERWYLNNLRNNQYHFTIKEGVESTMQKLRLRLKCSTVSLYRIRMNGSMTFEPILIIPSEFQDSMNDLGGVVMDSYKAFFNDVLTTGALIINDTSKPEQKYQSYANWLAASNINSSCCILIGHKKNILCFSFDKRDDGEITEREMELARSMLLKHREPLLACYSI